jgi:hypothetical protein
VVPMGDKIARTASKSQVPHAIDRASLWADVEPQLGVHPFGEAGESRQDASRSGLLNGTPSFFASHPAQRCGGATGSRARTPAPSYSALEGASPSARRLPGAATKAKKLAAASNGSTLVEGACQFSEPINPSAR